MSKFTAFPVTITGMNITERNLEGKYGAQDKLGITIQEANVTDRNGEALVIPEGAWLNGFCPAGSMDQIGTGQIVEVQMSMKESNGNTYYNFQYYPEKSPVAAPAQVAAQAAPVTQEANPVTREEFNALVDQVNELSF